MSFASYTDFGVALTRWLDIGTDVYGAALKADLITVGEERLFREARTREMETEFTDTISSGTMSLPSGYLALKTAYINSNPVQSLERRPPEWVRLNYPDNSGSSVPRYIARYGSNFIFGPYPDSAYTVKGVYYQRPTPISGSGLNTLFTNNPDLYLFACLAESSLVIPKNALMPLWEQKYLKLLASVNGEDRDEGASGSSLQVRAHMATANNFIIRAR